MLVNAPTRPLVPWVDLGAFLGFEKTLIKHLSTLRIFQQSLFYIGQADTFYPRRRAFQITRLFAIELQKGTAVLQHFLR